MLGDRRNPDNFEMPDAECPQGYPVEQAKRVVGEGHWEDFNEFMRGQTMSLCEGRHYNYKTREYETSPCVDQPHGAIIYKHDVERYLRGLPVID